MIKTVWCNPTFLNLLKKYWEKVLTINWEKQILTQSIKKLFLTDPLTTNGAIYHDSLILTEGLKSNYYPRLLNKLPMFKLVQKFIDRFWKHFQTMRKYLASLQFFFKLNLSQIPKKKQVKVSLFWYFKGFRWIAAK